MLDLFCVIGNSGAYGRCRRPLAGGGEKIRIFIKKFTPQFGGSTLLPGRSGGHGWIRRFFLWIFHPVAPRSVACRPSSGPCENSASQNGGLGGFLGLLVSKIGFSESNCVQQTPRELLKSFLDPFGRGADGSSSGAPRELLGSSSGAPQQLLWDASPEPKNV